MDNQFNFNRLIQMPEFRHTLKSILEIGDTDSEWRADFIDFVNSDSKDASTMFFYDMLPAVRFLKANPNQTVAYTVPDHRIFMNAPAGAGIGQQDYKWEFIYYHECMHQLWKTFDVQKHIEEEFGSCDMEILNIASDCVINDFLHINKRMPYPTDGLVTPEMLRTDYGVEYDRQHDTQFSLYEKLLKVADKIRKNPPKTQMNNGQGQGQSGQGQSGRGQSGQGKSGQVQSGQGQSGQTDPNSVNKMSGQEAANAADKAANEAQSAVDGMTDPKRQSEAQKHADKARQLADEARAAADAGDEATANAKAKEAIKEANKAKQGANSGKGSGNYDADNGYADMDEETEPYNPKFFEDIIRQYANKISGAFGEFCSKCRMAEKEVKKEGAVVRARRGAAWNKALDKKMNTFIQQRIIDKEREVEQTYHRLKRGTRPVRMGDILRPGTQIKEDKLNITVAFYVDRSGSMDGRIDQVFSLAYQISDKIQRNYSHEKVVGDIGFKYYAFDDYMKEIKRGQKAPANGGTMSLQNLLGYVEKQTKEYLINIILTDAEFSIDRSAVVKLVKSMDGMFFLIANQPKPECEDIEKQLKGQFVFLQANDEFQLDKY